MDSLLASIETLARCRTRARALERTLHDCAALKWEPFYAHRIREARQLPWDLILSADFSKHYKPDREVYLTAAEFLDLDPREIMLVAAHFYDLDAARSLGFQAAFVYRSLENGETGNVDRAAEGQFDVVAADLVDLTVQLGA